VAIPNFKKYQAKAKTSEAKLQLSAAYTAEQSFYSDFNIYHVCLGYMGYNPSNEVSQRYYAVGFKATGLAAAASGNPLQQAIDNGLLATACVNTGATLGSSLFEGGKSLSGVTATSTLFQANTAGSTSTTGAQTVGTETFIIGAVGPVDSNAAFITGAGMSGFTINQNKILSNIVVGY
jgi:type IV pilus assembly protein PilA